MTTSLILSKTLIYKLDVISTLLLITILNGAY